MSDAESVGSDEVSKLCREAGDLACFDEADDDGGGGAGAGAEVSERLSILVAVSSLFSVLGTLLSVKTTTAARWVVSFQPRGRSTCAGCVLKRSHGYRSSCFCCSPSSSARPGSRWPAFVVAARSPAREGVT